jgi:hypothetical protein
LERHLRLRSLGGPERTAAQEPRPALEGARNRGADGGLGANLSENGKLSSSARKECESLAEGCMTFGLDDLAMSHNDAFEWPSKDIFY